MVWRTLQNYPIGGTLVLFFLETVSGESGKERMVLCGGKLIISVRSQWKWRGAALHKLANTSDNYIGNF